jgi:hypothetical protein
MLDFCLSVSQVLGGLSSIYNLTYQIKDWSLSSTDSLNERDYTPAVVKMYRK